MFKCLCLLFFLCYSAPCTCTGQRLFGAPCLQKVSRQQACKARWPPLSQESRTQSVRKAISSCNIGHVFLLCDSFFSSSFCEEEWPRSLIDVIAWEQLLDLFCVDWLHLDSLVYGFCKHCFQLLYVTVTCHLCALSICSRRVSGVGACTYTQAVFVWPVCCLYWDATCAQRLPVLRDYLCLETTCT